MTTYIKKSVPQIYVPFEEKLDPETFPVGKTFQDYLDGQWVPLSRKQLKFREDNPQASVKEVFEMKLRERTVEEARAEMLTKIYEYDTSLSVNGFLVNGLLEAWIEPNTRSNYKQSIEAAKLLGEENISFFLNDMEFTVPTAKAEMLLAMIQLYADKCYMITKRHELAVNSLETVEEIDSFDYMAEYPQRLNFEL